VCTGCNLCRPSATHVHVGFEQSFGPEQYRVIKTMASGGRLIHQAAVPLISIAN